MMNYRNIQLPSSRILEWGKQGENKATRLSIDVSEFIERSEGTIAASCCRPDGKKYPHDCTINDTTVEIELSSYDTQVCGILTIVVSWMCGERIVKSETYCGEISRSISTSGEKPTPPFDGLIEQVCNAAIKTKESADSAEAAAQRAETAAERAENAGGITEETDPTVPAWAKQPTKPSYTADEVNARPADWKPTPQEIGAASAVDVVKLSGEITQLKQDVAAITPDDTTVDGKPWTSQHIVDMLCPPLEASGNPVQCYPVAGYPLGVKATWQPRQAGTGDPSPDNVRAITGLDEVRVQRSGRNLMPYTKPSPSTGTELPTADDYAPYTGTTATLSLQSTVYGGEVDLATGEGVETVHGIVLDGTEPWLESNLGSIGSKYFQYTVLDAQRLPSSSGSIILARSSQKISHLVIGNPYSENVDNAGWVYNTESSDYYGVRIRMSACADVDEWKSYLAAQYAAGTPVTIAYKLATPQPIRATGSQSLPAISGENVLITNADSLTVTGRADPVATVQVLADRVAALEQAAVNSINNTTEG